LYYRTHRAKEIARSASYYRKKVKPQRAAAPPPPRDLPDEVLDANALQWLERKGYA
jgi:hypothetical protein